MYYQIKVAEKDQDSLWRDKTDKKIVDHIMKVYTFGKIDSLCIIKKMASDQ